MMCTKIIITSLILAIVFLQVIGIAFGLDPWGKNDDANLGPCSNDQHGPHQNDDNENQPPTPPKPPATPKPPTVTETSCEADTDCYGGRICCIGKCRDSLTGVCKDINGDGVLDWVPYSSSENSQTVMGSVFDGIFHLIASFLGFNR